MSSVSLPTITLPGFIFKTLDLLSTKELQYLPDQFQLTKLGEQHEWTCL
jgi:hypothetical protein